MGNRTSGAGGDGSGSLLPQDIFIQQNIREEDVLIVSVGGNDIALRPNNCTICNMAMLMKCCPLLCLEHCACGVACPCEGAAGCSCLASPPCYGYFLHLFGTQIEAYIRRLTSVTKPKAVLVCMIYYPDESPSGSWADNVLGLLGYDSDPSKLQTLIRKTFLDATSRITVPGSVVIPVPLYRVLDGKNQEDYRARVEPSAQGGQKMAAQFLDLLQAFDGPGPPAGAGGYGSTAAASAGSPARLASPGAKLD